MLPAAMRIGFSLVPDSQGYLLRGPEPLLELELELELSPGVPLLPSPSPLELPERPDDELALGLGSVLSLHAPTASRSGKHVAAATRKVLTIVTLHAGFPRSKRKSSSCAFTAVHAETAAKKRARFQRDQNV